MQFLVTIATDFRTLTRYMNKTYVEDHEKVSSLLFHSKKLNFVAFSPQANYTDRATAACRRSLC
jgi:hypothetical protein